MFDFFKDTYMELSGLDMKKIEEEKKIKKEKEGHIKKRTKRLIIIIGILYLVIAGLNIYNIILAGIEPRITKYVVLSILDLFVLITVIKKNTSERLSLIGIILFIGSNFLLTKI